MLAVKDLCTRETLHHVNLALPTGLHCFYGGDGSGKDALLHCICGLSAWESGSITGNSSVVFCNGSMYDTEHLTLREIVRFVFTLEGEHEPEACFWARVSHPVLKGHMERLWRKRLGKLSKGERCMALMAVVSRLEREWYVFDGMLSPDGAESSRMMEGLVRGLRGREKGVILASCEKVPYEGFYVDSVTELVYGHLCHREP